MADEDKNEVAVDLSSEAGSEPFWIELRSGVQLQVIPAEGWVWDAAETYAQRRVAEIRQAHDDVESTGAEILTNLDLKDLDQLDALTKHVWSEGLARQVVIGWTGVGEDGEVAPVTPERVSQLMRLRNHAQIFRNKYLERMNKVWSEGNGSGASPAGTSATAPTTAQSAGNKTSRARKGGQGSTAKGARTSKTG